MLLLKEHPLYEGVVTTDWWNTADPATEKLAGNDIRMPHSLRTNKKITDSGIVSGVDRDTLAACVKRLLEMILWLE